MLVKFHEAPHIVGQSTLAAGLTHDDRKKIDLPPNLKKDRCYRKFGGRDTKMST
jgi:hypothetical protein